MRTSLTLLCLMAFVLGFALIGDAIAQPDNPTPAASDTGSDTESGETAPAEPTAEPAEEAEAPPVEAELATEEPSVGEVIDQGKGFFSNAKGGHWLLAFGFFAMFVGSVVRYLMKLKWKFWDSKTGGYVVAGSMGMATLGASVVATGSISVEAIWFAVSTTAIAMGLHGPAKAVKNKLKGASS